MVGSQKQMTKVGIGEFQKIVIQWIKFAHQLLEYGDEKALK